MAYIKHDSLVGKWVTINRAICGFAVSFAKRDRVKLVACGEGGYTIEGPNGNRITECGYDFFDKKSVSDDEVFVGRRKSKMLGKWVTTRLVLRDQTGCFTRGSRVKIVGYGQGGYSIEDSYGNKMSGCGDHFFCLFSASNSE